MNGAGGPSSLASTGYSAPWWLRNGHLQTLWQSAFRPVPRLSYRRRRIDTPDGDFLDLDFLIPGAPTTRGVLIIPGMEATSSDTHVRATAVAFIRRGWAVCAMNLRGCSGEPNRKLGAYHAGRTEDLATVVDHILVSDFWSSVVIVGFSLGGNLAVKYAGEGAGSLPGAVAAVVGISVPCDLGACARRLSAADNEFYMRRFIRKFHGRYREKAARFPELDISGFLSTRNFKELDDRYTAPLFGFTSAEDYWRRCSCKPLIAGVDRPTLIINSLDDPFLSADCNPTAEAAANSLVSLDLPAHGGHCGFLTSPSAFGFGEAWHEARAVLFCEAAVGLGPAAV